jgi:hypothetical protein
MKLIHYIILVFSFFPIVLFGEKISRPSLLSESLYAEQFYTNKPTDSLLWTKELMKLNIPNFKPYRTHSWYHCNYKNALSTLLEIQSETGEHSPYLQKWAINQNKVLLACEKKDTLELTPPNQTLSPSRAQGDFLYQMASWYFYQAKYEDALKYYQEAERLIDTPQRPKAAYMVVRSLAYLDRAQDAYNKIGEILDDPSLEKVHALAKNYRFIIMSNSRSFPLSFTKDLAKEHLLWLQNLIQLKPSDIKDSDTAFSIQKDAFAQFNLYFPFFDPKTKAVDWWLDDTTVPEGNRMKAVKELASKYPLIDWMQSKWAKNIFESDWLWALHKPDNSYWKENKNIVRHAFEKWQNTHDGAWLQIAIKRIHPTDKLASKILQDASFYLDSKWQSETPEFRLWLFDIWSHSIRILLGQGKITEATSIIYSHWDYYDKGLLSFPESNRYRYYSGNSYRIKSVLSKTLRWLVYTGKLEDARVFLKTIQKKFKGDFLYWENLLATNLDEALKVAFKKQYTFYSNFDNNIYLWQEMLNILPIKSLYTIAIDERVNQKYRSFIARTIFTRAVLLEYDNNLIDKYAALVGKLNPAIREQILYSVAGHDRYNYIEFLLTQPRFRPTVYLEYQSSKLAFNAIDVYNHNDNNWWCRYDSEVLRKRIFKNMKITPQGTLFLDSNESLTKELEPYLKKQKKLLLMHPYMRLIDNHEIAALEKIPSGPQYLSEAVIKKEDSLFWFFTTSKAKNKRAANLHRAVRTTRYGCERNGPHGIYSRKAFKLLHHRYKNTPWAKATPYWFDSIISK